MSVPPPPARPPPPKKLSTSERKHAVPIRDDDGVDLESEVLTVGVITVVRGLLLIRNTVDKTMVGITVGWGTVDYGNFNSR